MKYLGSPYFSFHVYVNIPIMNQVANVNKFYSLKYNSVVFITVIITV